MMAYYGDYIKSYSWFTNPKYANLAILLYILFSKYSHVQYWWICKIYSVLVILVAFLKASQLSLFPLLIFVMPLMWLSLKFINIQYENIEQCAMIQSKYRICIFYDFLLDILFLSLVTNFVCTCFFVDVYHHDCCLPRNLYTWDELHL